MARCTLLTLSFLLAALSAGIIAPNLLATPANAKSRGLTVKLRTEESISAPIAETVQLYDNSYALVIGNDDYRDGWPKLANAVADANEVATALAEAGFEVTLRSNLDSDELEDTLKKFFAFEGNDPEARLLIWYAGHGHSIRGEGFLVPVDAPKPSEPEFLLSALPMRDFDTQMRFVKAKHVLAIFDSCFSGTIFTTRAGAIPAAITRVTTKPTRQFMTSGDADQQVSDDGTFRRLFLQALNGNSIADHNGDGYLTGTELGQFLSDEVTNYTEGTQTPRYGKLRSTEFNQGDFVFALPSARAGGPPPPNGGSGQGSAGLVAEIELWSAVKDSEDAGILQVYLDDYPTGRFARQASDKIAEIELWHRASASADAETVNSYLEKFPSGRHAAEARTIVAEIDLWDAVRKSDDPDAAGRYLSKYPSGRFAAPARTIVAEADLWREVSGSDSADEVQRYLDRYPAGRFSEPARELIEELELAAIPPEPDPVEPEPLRWFLAVYDDLDFYGGDIYPKGVTKTSMEACAQACADETRCNNFTFNAKADRCFLKEDFVYTVNFDGAQSGMFYRDSTGQSRPRFAVNWEVWRKYDMPGGDFQTLRVDTYEQCIAACNGDDRCRAFTYSPVSGRDYCFLKGANAGALVPYTKTNVISGRRITGELQPSAVWPLEQY